MSSSFSFLPSNILKFQFETDARKSTDSLMESLSRTYGTIIGKPSREYYGNNSVVGREYDAWTDEGILESYWGDHIHLGFYKLPDFRKQDFVKAKSDFIDKLLDFSGINIDSFHHKISILDIGCGIGGTCRKLGPLCQATGITLSNSQLSRAKALSAHMRDSIDFQIMDAQNLTFRNNSFDIVWVCESTEHMADKLRCVDEAVRVLKPGGRLVLAAWCQRTNNMTSYSSEEHRRLAFLTGEWCHPSFFSMSQYINALRSHSDIQEDILFADWTNSTLPSWRHSVWVGLQRPWPMIRRPSLWFKCVREAITLERMHNAFATSLMKYGVFAAEKMKNKT